MRVSKNSLRAFATDVVAALGADAANAEHVADVLVRADSRGYGTNGVAILPMYHEMVADGAIDPEAAPRVSHGPGATASVAGRGAFGQLTGLEATAAGVAVAETAGAGVVWLRGGTHLGPIGEYARRAARSETIFLGFVNTGGGAKNTAPYGGHGRKLSTNPLAFGVPTFDALPFDVVVDVATSQVSGSVVRERNVRGESLPDVWTTSKSGDPVEDPGAFLEGAGALLPLGGRPAGHKGFALAVVAELLAGLVGDNPVVGEQDPAWFTNGAAFVFVDPTRFCPRSTVESRVAALADHLRADASAVRLPGEGAHRRAETARVEGVAFTADDIAPLAALAKELRIDPPSPLREAFDSVNASDENVRTW